MSSGAYALGVAELLAFLAGAAFSAFRLRAWLLPGWSGSVARLAEAVLGLSVIVCLSELLGLVGLFGDLPLLVGVAGTAFGTSRLPARSPIGDSGDLPERPPIFPTRSVAIAVALALSLVVVVDWLAKAILELDNGIFAIDSMWYELPNAARFAQTGSLTGLHLNSPLDLLQWFFPMNSELLHAVGMVLTGRDFVSPLVNLGWLGLALFAAWCIGRPYGTQVLSVLAVSPLVASPAMQLSNAGVAKSDIATLALLLASAAILVNGARPQEGRGAGGAPAPLAAIAVAGLAAGLAAGTRLNPVPIVAVLGIGLIMFTGRGLRLRVAAAWFGPVLATSAFWYLRNLFTVGNPLPWLGVHLGPLSLPATHSVVTDYPLSHTTIASLMTNGSDWNSFIFPGLKATFGDLWFLVLGGALAAMLLLMFEREAPVRRALGASALVGVGAYLFTPYSAGGVNGTPTVVAVNLRFVIPALALGIALLPTLSLLRATAARWVVSAVLLLTFLFVFPFAAFFNDPNGDTALIVGAILAAGAVATALLARRLSRVQLAVCAALTILVAAAAYRPIADNYLQDRYTRVWGTLNLTNSFAWADEVSGARIGIDGTTAAQFQYGYYGRDISNTVEYVGRKGPAGSFSPIETCTAWKRAVNRGNYDYLVTSPTFNLSDELHPGYAPEQDWLDHDPAASPVLSDGPVAVFRLDGSLDPARCARIRPLFSGLPPQLR